MNPVEEYQALTSDVANTVARARQATEAAEEAHAAGQQQVAAQLAAARAALLAQRQTLTQAEEEVHRTDDTAKRIWLDVASYVGRRAAKQLVDLPVPRPAPAGANAEDLLAEAKELMARARRGEWSPDPMKYSGVVAMFIGAVVAATIFGLARLVLGFGSEAALLPNLLAQLGVFLSPFAGIPLIVWGMARFRGQRTDVGTVGLTVLGGLIVSCVLTFLIN